MAATYDQETRTAHTLLFHGSAQPTQPLVCRFQLRSGRSVICAFLQYVHVVCSDRGVTVALVLGVFDEQHVVLGDAKSFNPTQQLC